MAKQLNRYTFIDGKQCLTETNYKGHKIYKVHYRSLDYYQILEDGKLKGVFWKLKDAKEKIDEISARDGLI